MAKIDFTKSLKQLYAPAAQAFTVVDVPPLSYLMADGHGDPNSAPAYAQAIEALYALAYRIKFICKGELGQDYVVPPLEGLWWATDMAAFATRDKSAWDWTMMIMQPEWVTGAIFERALAEVQKKKPLPGLPGIRLERYSEGLSAQILHVGSYDDEAPTLEFLHTTWLAQNSYAASGKHHEIYLSDARRTPPAKLRTVLRQPIRAV